MLVPQLASKGKVEWGWLGVSITEVSDEDAERLKLADSKGVLVRGVIPGEPAERGGLKANDVLTTLDGTHSTVRGISSASCRRLRSASESASVSFARGRRKNWKSRSASIESSSPL